MRISGKRLTLFSKRIQSSNKRPQISSKECEYLVEEQLFFVNNANFL